MPRVRDTSRAGAARVIPSVPPKQIGKRGRDALRQPGQRPGAQCQVTAVQPCRGQRREVAGSGGEQHRQPRRDAQRKPGAARAEQQHPVSAHRHERALPEQRDARVGHRQRQAQRGTSSHSDWARPTALTGRASLARTTESAREVRPRPRRPNRQHGHQQHQRRQLVEPRAEGVAGQRLDGSDRQPAGQRRRAPNRFPRAAPRPPRPDPAGLRCRPTAPGPGRPAGRPARPAGRPPGTPRAPPGGPAHAAQRRAGRVVGHRPERPAEAGSDQHRLGQQAGRQPEGQDAHRANLDGAAAGQPQQATGRQGVQAQRVRQRIGLLRKDKPSTARSSSPAARPPAIQLSGPGWRRCRPGRQCRAAATSAATSPESTTPAARLRSTSTIEGDTASRAAVGVAPATASTARKTEPTAMSPCANGRIRPCRRPARTRAPPAPGRHPAPARPAQPAAGRRRSWRQNYRRRRGDGRACASSGPVDRITAYSDHRLWRVHSLRVRLLPDVRRTAVVSQE